MIRFAFSTLLPAALIALAAIYGGVWVVLALLSITALVISLDRLVKSVPAAEEDREFPAATGLGVTLALAHFAVLALVVWSFGATHLDLWAKVGLWLSAGLWIGQVSNANAHELIHDGRRALHRLGMWVYISVLFGHHTSAHVLVHHRYVALWEDPNTARRGESYYAFLRRSWSGSFREGYRAEAARLARVGRSRWHHPYLTYLGGAVLMLIAAFWLGGPAGLWGYICVAAHAQSQLLLSDYVQHYGLQRARREDGKPAPVTDAHSWNTPHWYSSSMLLNAPRHSDHHTHPSRAFPSLRLPEEAPTLPRSLPVMAAVALVPPLWRRIMDPRVAKWSA